MKEPYGFAVATVSEEAINLIASCLLMTRIEIGAPKRGAGALLRTGSV
jgi:hypothetical protein